MDYVEMNYLTFIKGYIVSGDLQKKLYQFNSCYQASNYYVGIASFLPYKLHQDSS